MAGMIYRAVVTVEISCAHQLHLPYESACNRLHGHNYKVEVGLIARALNSLGMVADFGAVKETVRYYDHKFLGMMKLDGDSTPEMEIHPSTAEMFASALFHWVGSALVPLKKKYGGDAKVEYVTLWETPNNKVTVEAE